MAGMKLADYLKTKKLSQEEFGLSVGCTQGRISQLVAGDMPSLELAQNIAKATNGKVGINDWEQKAA